MRDEVDFIYINIIHTNAIIFRERNSGSGLVKS